MAELQTAADAQAGTGDQVAPEQAAPIARSDTLVNASAAGGGVAHQIADRVASEASTLTAQTGRPDAPTFAVKHEPAAKVLHIQLQPDGLGTVTIRMSVKDQSLRLDLEVGRGETAHLIQRDRETLSALLRSAGYLIDGVDVRIADPAGANAQTGSGQANTPMQGGGQSGSSQAEGRSPGERSQDGGRRTSAGTMLLAMGAMVKTNKLVMLLAAAAFTFSVTSAAAGTQTNLCEREMVRAAEKHGVPLGMLYAVGLTETGRGDSLRPYALNIEGRASYDDDKATALRRFEGARAGGAKLIDVGCMQINHHFHARQFGSVDQMFEPAANVDYAARFLKELKAREGNWTMAVARYHAGPNNDPAQKRYVCRVITNMVATGFGAWTGQSRAFCQR